MDLFSHGQIFANFENFGHFHEIKSSPKFGIGRFANLNPREKCGENLKIESHNFFSSLKQRNISNYNKHWYLWGENERTKF